MSLSLCMREVYARLLGGLMENWVKCKNTDSGETRNRGWNEPKGMERKAPLPGVE